VNYNGMIANRRIIMVYLQFLRIVMASIQITLFRC
jgi:hypothetical protein